MADNIAFGDWERFGTIGAHQGSRGAAGVDEMIDAMPGGYQTMLGRAFGRYEPSGGQWQQLAIARAVAATPASDTRRTHRNLDIDTDKAVPRYRAVAEDERSCLFRIVSLPCAWLIASWSSTPGK